jgi:hypothetical protein
LHQTEISYFPSGTSSYIVIFPLCGKQFHVPSSRAVNLSNTSYFLHVIIIRKEEI